MEEEWLAAVLNDPDIILWDGYVLDCYFYSTVKCVFGDGEAVACHVELDKAVLFLIDIAVKHLVTALVFFLWVEL